MSSRHGWSRPLRLAPAAWLLGVAGCYSGAAFQDDPDPTAAGSTGGEGVHGEPDALLGPPPEIDGLSPSPAPGGVPLVVTWHPSAALRVPSSEMRERMFEELVSALKRSKKMASRA